MAETADSENNRKSQTGNTAHPQDATWAWLGLAPNGLAFVCRATRIKRADVDGAPWPSSEGANKTMGGRLTHWRRNRNIRLAVALEDFLTKI